jgi:hypothetical protein
MVARRALLLLWLLAGTAASARAQVCAGLPSLRERPVIATLDVAVADSVRSSSAGVTVGRRAFAGAFVGRTVYSDVSFAATTADATSTVIGMGAGYELSLVPDATAGGTRVGLCPIVTGQWDTGPDGDFGGNHLDSDGWSAGGGVSVGGVLLDRGFWRLFPFGQVSFVHASATVHDFPFVGSDSHAKGDGWLFALGVGVGLGSRVTVSPELVLPSGTADAGTSYGLSVNVGLGGGSASPARP